DITTRRRDVADLAEKGLLKNSRRGVSHWHPRAQSREQVANCRDLANGRIRAFCRLYRWPFYISVFGQSACCGGRWHFRTYADQGGGAKPSHLSVKGELQQSLPCRSEQHAIPHGRRCSTELDRQSLASGSR